MLSWPQIKSFFNAFSVFTANLYQALLKDAGILTTISRPALLKLICKEQLFEVIQGRCRHLVQIVIRSS